MVDKINFRINNLGPINQADINIGKINVVGGHNATGKSTASKLLYCFLRSSFSKRGDFAYEKIKKQIQNFLRNIYGKFGLEKPEYVSKEATANAKLNYFQMYLDNKDYLESNFDDVSILEKYYQAKLDYSKINKNLPLTRFLHEEMNEIDDILNIISENGNALYMSILRNSVSSEFASKTFNFDSVLKGIKNGIDFKFSLNLKDYSLNSDEAFVSEGSFEIEDVFYIDSFSFFEASKPWKDTNTHVGYLRRILNERPNENLELFDEKVNKNIISIEEEIKNIIGGEITVDHGRFYFTSENAEPIDMTNTASGIKQIGIIQLLLANRQLKQDCFLIIDEPEVNLHPEWQFKLANILILLVERLNITIYINTHSPMFIEAIEVFTQYYNLEDETNYYLTVHSDEGYTFKNIDKDNLYELYDNLAKPYDAIEVYRLKSEYKK